MIATVRVLIVSCALVILALSGLSNGRIVYSRIPQYDPHVGTANYKRGGGRGGDEGAGLSRNGGYARGHGHGHATSYQNFVLHSYHPVKVYLKPHHHHRDYN